MKLSAKEAAKVIAARKDADRAANAAGECGTFVLPEGHERPFRALRCASCGVEYGVHYRPPLSDDRAASAAPLQLACEIVEELYGKEPNGNADCWWSMVRRTEKILRADRAASAAGDEPDIFADALSSQLDAIRRAAFDECIALVPEIERRIMFAQPGEKIRDIIEAELVAARDATPTAMCSEAIPESGPAQCKHGHWLGSPEHPTTRSDKGKHHHVAGVLQEDVDEAEN